ncbi:DUF6327 family protein [Gramella sp. AN32]|uniref:DUF6327 family protein n=1 Tax=Christiangramia antarctica TaxID=2058158 RepID=A0ABW5WZ01_9FLAO|nr:DUF6327 family protein [Gramella sp. AN32]MCM4155001.1 hypothetical protein [Gramella sp. AN32]
MRIYSSFQEIDRDLKILQLQTEIDKEELKLSFDQTKDELTPGSIIGSSFMALFEKFFLLKAVSKIFGIRKFM